MKLCPVPTANLRDPSLLPLDMWLYTRATLGGIFTLHMIPLLQSQRFLTAVPSAFVISSCCNSFILKLRHGCLGTGFMFCVSVSLPGYQRVLKLCNVRDLIVYGGSSLGDWDWMLNHSGVRNWFRA